MQKLTNDDGVLIAQLELNEMFTEGLLWYINRVAFHPHGMALAFDVDPDGTVHGYQLWGNRDEPWEFGMDEVEKFIKVQALFDMVKANPDE